MATIMMIDSAVGSIFAAETSSVKAAETSIGSSVAKALESVEQTEFSQVRSARSSGSAAGQTIVQSTEESINKISKIRQEYDVGLKRNIAFLELVIMLNEQGKLEYQ